MASTEGSTMSFATAEMASMTAARSSNPPSSRSWITPEHGESVISHSISARSNGARATPT